MDGEGGGSGEDGERKTGEHGFLMEVRGIRGDGEWRGGRGAWGGESGGGGRDKC